MVTSTSSISVKIDTTPDVASNKLVNVEVFENKIVLIGTKVVLKIVENDVNDVPLDSVFGSDVYNFREVT